MDEFRIVVTDAADPLVMIGLAWLAILGMLAWGLVAELWRLVRGRERVLFMHMLERRDLTLEEAVRAEGYDGMVRALERCFTCSDQPACRRSLRWGWLGTRDPQCPNAALFAHASEARKTSKTRNTEAAT